MRSLLLTLLFLLPGAGPLLADDYPKDLRIDIRHYAFSLKLSDQTDRIEGTATITVYVKEAGVEQIRLDLVNSAKSPDRKGMTVSSVTTGDRQLSFTHSEDALFIAFSEPPTAGSVRKVTVTYAGEPADGLKIGPNKYGDRTFFSGNWPNRAKHWLPVINHPYDKATCEFKITAPSRYRVVSNGLLKEETDLPGGQRFTHWKQSVPIPSWLFVVGAAEFSVQYLDEFKGISVQTWVYPQDRVDGARELAAPTTRALSFFSEYVGPYPYEKLANIQSTSTPGAMETATAVFYNENAITGEQTPWLHNAIIHEVAHHWFGNSVTESTWDDAWLSEGFATYFTMLFREHAYGREDFVSELVGSRNSVFDYYRENPGYKIVDSRSPEKGPVTSGVTYQKGAWILHMLRNRVGDRAFKQGIRAYYTRFKNGIASTAEFRFEMEQASGKNLKPFFDRWLRRGDNPKLKGGWSYDQTGKNLTISLQQVQESGTPFNVPVEIGIYRRGEVLPEIKTLTMDGRTTQLKIPVEEEPREVVLDPRTVLLAEWEFNRH